MHAEDPDLCLALWKTSVVLCPDFYPQLAETCPSIASLQRTFFGFVRAYRALTRDIGLEGISAQGKKECIRTIVDKLKLTCGAVNRILCGRYFPVRRDEKDLLDKPEGCEVLAAINRQVNGCDNEQSVVVLGYAVLSELLLNSLVEVTVNTKLVVEVELCAYLAIPHTDTVVVTGGRSGSQYDLPVVETALVYSVSKSNGEVIVLKPMKCARSQHAIAHMLNYLYVFGGMRGGILLNSAEKFATSGNLAANAWERIVQPMCEPRYQLTACAYFLQIYLFGGNCHSAECFDPYSSRFYPLPLTLSECSHCTTVTNGDEFIVISRTIRSRWRLGQGAVEERRHEPWPHLSESLPVLHERVIYSVCKGVFSAFHVDRNVEVTPRLEVIEA